MRGGGRDRGRECPGVIVSSDPAATIASLREAPGKDIWLFRGGEFFRSLLDQGLVDSVEVAIVPVLLGGGTPLLPHPATHTRLELANHRVLPKTGTVTLDYAPAR